MCETHSASSERCKFSWGSSYHAYRNSIRPNDGNVLGKLSLFFVGPVRSWALPVNTRTCFFQSLSFHTKSGLTCCTRSGALCFGQVFGVARAPVVERCSAWIQTTGHRDLGRAGFSTQACTRWAFPWVHHKRGFETAEPPEHNHECG